MLYELYLNKLLELKQEGCNLKIHRIYKPVLL